MHRNLLPIRQKGALAQEKQTKEQRFFSIMLSAYIVIEMEISTTAKRYGKMQHPEDWNSAHENRYDKNFENVFVNSCLRRKMSTL